MHQKFDIFEVRDSLRIWRGHVSTFKEAQKLLDEIAEKTTNECFVVNTLTKEKVLRANVAKSAGAE